MQQTTLLISALLKQVLYTRLSIHITFISSSITLEQPQMRFIYFFTDFFFLSLTVLDICSLLLPIFPLCCFLEPQHSLNVNIQNVEHVDPKYWLSIELKTFHSGIVGCPNYTFCWIVCLGGCQCVCWRGALCKCYSPSNFEIRQRQKMDEAQGEPM